MNSRRHFLRSLVALTASAAVTVGLGLSPLLPQTKVRHTLPEPAVHSPLRYWNGKMWAPLPITKGQAVLTSATLEWDPPDDWVPCEVGEQFGYFVKMAVPAEDGDDVLVLEDGDGYAEAVASCYFGSAATQFKPVSLSYQGSFVPKELQQCRPDPYYYPSA